MEIGQSETAPATFGKFELAEQLGQGGMATVHRAFLRGMGGFRREVVIKRILPELAADQHFRNMFIEEAKLSALLEHPNVVQIYDFGVIGETYFIAMEYIQGVTLLALRKHYLRLQQPFPAQPAAFVVHQMCMGLAYTHALQRGGQPLGLVHRDISPSNVMISTHGAVKLLDFGIAKAVEVIDDENTRTGHLKGKWSYMSPEQVLGLPLTARTDIFSTGIVLWEILTGRRLFKDRTDYLTLSNVAEARVPPLQQMRPDLPPEYDEICRRALAKNPADRYGSAEEMAEALERKLGANRFANSMMAELIAPLIDRPAETEAERSAGGSVSSSRSGTGSAPQTHSKFPLAAKDTELDLSAPPMAAAHRLPWVLIAAVASLLTAGTLILAWHLLRPEPPPPPPSPSQGPLVVPAPTPPPAKTGADNDAWPPRPRTPRLRPQAVPLPRPGAAAVVPPPGEHDPDAGINSRPLGPGDARPPGQQIPPDAVAAPGASPPAPTAAPPRPAPTPRPGPETHRPAKATRRKPGHGAPAKPSPGPKSKAGQQDLPDLKAGDLADPYD